jgi:hypothetical protein
VSLPLNDDLGVPLDEEVEKLDSQFR